MPRQRPIRRQTPLREDSQRLQMAGLGAGRSRNGRDPHQDSYLGAQYARLRPGRGHKKPLGAVKHSLICICWHMLSTGEVYTDLGGDYFRKRDPERITKRLIAHLESLGHVVRSNNGNGNGPSGGRNLIVIFLSRRTESGSIFPVFVVNLGD